MSEVSEEAVKCSRCKKETSVLLARKENFCSACFVKFLRGKQRKQMLNEKFKVKYGNKQDDVTKVLLCLSFGKSSLALLDMLASSFKEQAGMHRGRQGYHLTCVTLSNGDEALTTVIKKKISEVIEEYKLDELQINFKVLDIDSYIPSNAALRKISLHKDFDIVSNTINESKEMARLKVKDLVSICSQRTTKEDLLDIVKYDLYLNTALAEDCDTILFGHSMTKLADDIISLTVKGRGALINERLTDGPLSGSDNKVEIIHPLRDVLQTEIDLYDRFVGMDKFVIEDEDLDSQKTRMTKYKTVNELTRLYFQNLDKDYSEVISTVVKIGSKLAQPTVSEGEEVHICRICGSSIYKDPKSWLLKNTVTEGAPVVTEEDKAVLKYYQDSVSVNQDASKGEGDKVDLCYGCIVTMGDSKELVWPERDQDILNEYILTDDEE